MLTATDLELTIQTPLMWEGDPIVLPFARLSAILATANADEVTLTPDGASCTIQAGGGTWRLPTEDANEYPPRSSLQTEAKVIGCMPADQFRRVIASVRFATDNESSRYALGAVRIEYERKEETISFVATDGRRMAVAECKVSEGSDPDDSNTMAPRRFIDVLYRLANCDDAIQLERTATEVIATIGETVVSARQVEGRYPKWRDVEPSRDHVKASLVQVGPLLHACEMAAICASEDSKGTTWVFTPQGLFLTAQSSQFGESSATCEVVEAGHKCSVKIDTRFAIEWLRTLDPAETVEVEAENDQAAVVFRGGEPVDGKNPLRNVVMPLAKD